MHPCVFMCFGAGIYIPLNLKIETFTTSIQHMLLGYAKQLSALGPFCLIHRAFTKPCVSHVNDWTTSESLKVKSEVCQVFQCSACHPCAGAILTHECCNKSFRLLLARVEQGLHVHLQLHGLHILIFHCKFFETFWSKSGRHLDIGELPPFPGV